MTRVVVGIGMSSTGDGPRRWPSWSTPPCSATGSPGGDVEAIATRACFVADDRLALGPPVIGFADDVLIAASSPTERTVGIPARVAETAARIAVGADPAAELRTARSAHTTLVAEQSVGPRHDRHRHRRSPRPAPTRPVAERTR